MFKRRKKQATFSGRSVKSHTSIILQSGSPTNKERFKWLTQNVPPAVRAELTKLPQHRARSAPEKTHHGSMSRTVTTVGMFMEFSRSTFSAAADRSWSSRAGNRLAVSRKSHPWLFQHRHSNAALAHPCTPRHWDLLPGNAVFN